MFSHTVGREGCCKQITLVCACSVSATLGLLTLIARVPSLAHAAQVLGCSAGNRLRPALGCMHLPGLSCSGSGTRVVLRGTDSVGPVFWALPRSKQFRQERQDIYLSFNDEVFGKRGCCNLSPPCCSVIWVYNRRTFSGGCSLSRTPRSFS